MSEVRPLVAVVGRRASSVPILRFSATLAAEAICEAVWAAGGEPLVLHGPAADPGAALASRLARFDAVLLPGGADVGPHRYGADAEPETVEVVDFQDDFDLAVATTVVHSGQPTLAICRGMQVLNVALGGTLVQHLPSTAVAHTKGIHEVTIAAGSKLHALLGERVDVSSYHHQALGSVAAELIVTATADDDVVEAVEHRTADIIAVQWHPEDRFGSSATDLLLFTDLVERARRKRD